MSIVQTNNLFEAVEAWGESKHLNDPKAQLNKVVEELGEIAHEITRNNYSSKELEDAIGDTMVTIIILAHMLGLDAKYCLYLAYNEIKDRTGITENGTFVKDTNYREDIEGWGNPKGV